MSEFNDLLVENNLTVENKLLLDDDVVIHMGRGRGLELNPKYKLSYTNNNEGYLLIKNNQLNTDFSLVYEKKNIVNSGIPGLVPKETVMWKTDIDKDGNYNLSHNIDDNDNRVWKKVASFKRQINTITENNFTRMEVSNLEVTNKVTIKKSLLVEGEINSNRIKMFDLNTGIGYEVLKNNKGDRNTAIGGLSIFENLNGNDNTGIGYNALYSNTNGLRNTAIGSGSLEKNKTGSHNVSIGYKSQSYNKRGDYNTNIGANTNLNQEVFNVVGTTTIGGNTTTLKNFSTAIGYGAVADISHQIIIGRSTETIYIPGGLRVKMGDVTDVENNEYKDFIETLTSFDLSKNELNTKVISIINDISNIMHDISNIDISKNDLISNFNNLDISSADLQTKYNILSDSYSKLDISYVDLNNKYNNLVSEINDIKTELNNKANSNHDHDFLRVNNSEASELTPLVPDELD